jgi:TM2 domain-containing membrane protein YozV
MDSNRIALLKDFFQKNGLHYFKDIRKAEALLKDFFPDKPKVANTMVSALKAGALDSLTGDTAYSMPKEILISNVAKRMVEEYGVKETEAIEAVCWWAEIFGISDAAFSSTLKNRFSSVVAGSSSYSSASSTLSTSSKEIKECPYCGEDILAKAKVCKHCKSNVEMMECPFCSEEILKSSEICEHCRMDLKKTEEKKTITPNEEKKVPIVPATPQNNQSYDSADYKNSCKEGKSKSTALLLCFFLGGIGGHKYYLGNWVWGILYTVFAWTYVPVFFAVIDFLYLAFLDKNDFNRKYNK